MNALDRLTDIMKTLRSEKGCPWDKAQTHKTLKPYLIEEAYEVIDALDCQEPNCLPERLKEELGDLLFQIVFHCQLAAERGEFTIDDVCEGIINKMINRHPHVFSDKQFSTPDEVSRQWEERKLEEGKNRVSIFDGIPSMLPALLKAHRIQSRASKTGFDWTSAEEALPKLEEEIKELSEAIISKDGQAVEEELGDMLFTVVNVARLSRVNPEEALNRTISKFISRFGYIERYAAQNGLRLSDMTLQEMNRLWEESKLKTHPNPSNTSMED